MLRERIGKFFFGLGCLLLALRAEAAERPKPVQLQTKFSCELGFAGKISATKEVVAIPSVPDPLTRYQRVGRWVKGSPRGLYNLVIKNTWEDYRKIFAIKDPKRRWGGLAHRFLFAPRFREREITGRQIDALLKKAPRYLLKGEGSNGKFAKVVVNKPTKAEIKAFRAGLGKNPTLTISPAPSRFLLEGTGSKGRMHKYFPAKPQPAEIDAFRASLGNEPKFTLSVEPMEPSMAEWIRGIKKLDPKYILREELKGIAWGQSASEPVFDGVIELTSQLKQRYGKYIGLSNRPFKSNLSLPGGILVGGITGYSTLFFAWDNTAEPLWEKYTHIQQEKTKAEAVDKGLVGANYALGWEEIGAIDSEQLVQLHDFNANAINNWGNNLNSTDPRRPLPPRFYQFQLEGLLAPPDKNGVMSAEMSAFEDIALYALQRAQNEVAKDSSLKEDQLTKKYIMEKLALSEFFRNKPPLVRQLLSLAFEPPVFFNQYPGEELDFSWYQLLVGGTPEGYTDYLEHSRPSSDIHWLAQLALNKSDPTLKAVRDLYPEEKDRVPGPAAAYIASMNFSPYAKTLIEQKQRRAEGSPWFPPSQAASLYRIDHALSVSSDPEYQLPFFRKSGEEKLLASELDYLEIWQEHPLFAKEMDAWEKSSQGMSFAEFERLKIRTDGLYLIQKIQEATRSVRPQSDGSLPPPAGPDYCYLRQNSAYVNEFVESALRIGKVAPADAPICGYLLGIGLWQGADRAFQDWQRSKKEDVLAAMERDQKENLRECQSAEYQAKFLAESKLDLPSVNKILTCGMEKKSYEPSAPDLATTPWNQP